MTRSKKSYKYLRNMFLFVAYTLRKGEKGIDDDDDVLRENQ